MEITVTPVGRMQANAYVLSQAGEERALVIDPGAEPEAIRLALAGKRLAGILLTHGHIDHIGAAGELRGPEVPVYIHEADAPMLTNARMSLAVLSGDGGNQGPPDFCLAEGETTLCGLTFEVLHTPGHTAGSVCFRFGNDLFTGDTLFRQGVGRTDFPGGDGEALRASLARLLALEGEIRVYPGHGDATTIRQERRYFR